MQTIELFILPLLAGGIIGIILGVTINKITDHEMKSNFSSMDIFEYAARGGVLGILVYNLTSYLELGFVESIISGIVVMTIYKLIYRSKTKRIA